jgi:hypothetical protein
MWTIKLAVLNISYLASLRGVEEKGIHLETLENCFSAYCKAKDKNYT